MIKAIKRFFGLLLLLVLLGAAFLGWRGWTMYREMEEELPLEVRVAQVRLQEDFTPFAELPETYVNAVVAIEDPRFWRHGGVDLISTARAVVRDILARDWVEGGSTITQQLAKNLCFDQDKSLIRKAAELFAALALERDHDKQEIFELYVNSIYFGNGWYTVSAASEGYFGRPPAALTDYQCTQLACYPNAPSVFMEEENEEALEERRQEVVRRMERAGYLTPEQALALL